MSRKKRNFDLTPHQGHTRMVARQSYLLRRGIRNHGGDISKLANSQQSVFKRKARKKPIRSFVIPQMDGWAIARSGRWWIIKPPKGGVASLRTCETPSFRGESISVLPSGGKESLEIRAKRIAGILRGACETMGATTCLGVTYHGSRTGGVLLNSGRLFVRVAPPQEGDLSTIERNAWRLARELVQLITPHLTESNVPIGTNSIPSAQLRESEKGIPKGRVPELRKK